MRVLSRTVVEEKIKSAKWEYIAPEFKFISEDYRFRFKNREGKEYEFSFDEIWTLIYDENYVGCHHCCEECLTPIC